MKNKEVGLSCMLNTEVGTLLAVIRRSLDPNPPLSPLDDPSDSAIICSLKSLRSLIFNPQQQWRTIHPSLYLRPFLDVVQSDDVNVIATALALSAILKILKLNIFDEKTPGAKEAINSVVNGITNCRIQKADSFTEEGVLMKILQLMIGVMGARASPLLTDRAVCTMVNASFQVVQRGTRIGDLLQRAARYTMHDLIYMIFSRLPKKGDSEDPEDTSPGEVGFGIRCIEDIFLFLCSLLNAVSMGEAMDGSSSQSPDEDVQMFALVLINTAVELSGEEIGNHPKLLKMITDNLFYNLIHYATTSGPLVVSMICGTTLSIYHFLRRFARLQLEAFFTYALFRIATTRTRTKTIQSQEVAVEGIIAFCKQPTFGVEIYVNYDCDPFCNDLFEVIMKLLCKHAFPTTGAALTSLQIQTFEGLLTTIHAIAESVDKEGDYNSTPMGEYLVVVREYKPFWEEKSIDDEHDEEELESFVNFVRFRKAQKRKMMIAADHFNRDPKKGLDYLKLSHLVPDPADPKCFALFFRHAPSLDKTAIGEFLGDPDEFHLQVLEEFTKSFDFTGMILDTALRTYLKAFRLPGEAQKIERILEALSEQFYTQESSKAFNTKDAVLLLCYSLIMLNTDQHNPQVKKKMTQEEFIHNNRKINAGEDLPREFLSQLFQSISSNAITLFSQMEGPTKMNPSQWLELTNRSKAAHPFIVCNNSRLLGRDMFATIAGPSVAVLCAIFEHADEDVILQECIEALFSVARIAQYGLVDTLDEVLGSFCKFTTLMNPYVTAEETLYVFSNDVKPRMAILAVFTIANNFENSIRGGWRNIVDCLLKLKRLKLLPQSVVEGITDTGIDDDPSKDSKAARLMGQFSHFWSMENMMEDSLSLEGSQFEENLKIIQHCRIGRIFANTNTLPEESLLNLGRSLIFAAAGRGQKFSTPVEEEETVGFCWDLITTITLPNTHRFPTFWPSYHDYLLAVSQFPFFSPVPFAERAIMSLSKICIKLLSVSPHAETKFSEDLIFKSINLVWKLEKEILDTCCVFIAGAVCKILTEYSQNLQGQLGWKSVFHLLSVSGRRGETYEQASETLISFMSDDTRISRVNYMYCIETAFDFVALKRSRVDKNFKILDCMSDSVKLLIRWYKNGYSDLETHNGDDSMRSFNFTMSLFLKLGEALKLTSLARREEVRNRGILSLQKSFTLASEMGFSSINCFQCFNLVICPMVNDLHEKMLDYSRREDKEIEVRSMEETFKLGMEMHTNVYLQLMETMAESQDFDDFWKGVLRRMDACMKIDLGAYGSSRIPEIVPCWLTKMIISMKEKGVLKMEDDMWESTYTAIKWIAPSHIEDMFPETDILI